MRITFSANRNFFKSRLIAVVTAYLLNSVKFLELFHFSIYCYKAHGVAANADVFSVAVIVTSLNFMALASGEGQEGLLDWTSVPGGLVCQ